MKKLSLIFVSLLLACNVLFAQEPVVTDTVNKRTQQELTWSQIKPEQPVRQEPIVEKQGCCSHHGGVCGCDPGSGRQKCCDGSLSPSCRCGD